MSTPARYLRDAAAPPSADAMAAQWAGLVEQVEQISPLIGSAMRLSVRVVSLVPGHLVYALAPGIPGEQAAELGLVGMFELQDQVARMLVVEAGGPRPGEGRRLGLAGAAAGAGVVFERQAAAVAGRVGDEDDPGQYPQGVRRPG